MLIAKKYFPENKKQWIYFSRIAIPIILGSMMYSLNGFVDNFMVGTVKGGVGALSAANTWTAIVFGVYTALGSAGSIFIAQYYNKGDFAKAQQVQSLRINLSIFFGLGFSLFAWINPVLMIKIIAGSGPSNSSQANIDSYNLTINLGSQYIRIIAITWMTVAISSSLSYVLAETGHGKYSFFTDTMGLLINITGNSILIYGLNFGVLGAAIASVGARLTTFTFYNICIVHIKFKIRYNFKTMFDISWLILRQYFKRWALFTFSSLAFIFIEMRIPLFARAYPTGSINNSPIGALNVLGLTFAIMNIFLTTFAGIEANTANFVGKELGRGNIRKAIENSHRTKGYNTLVAMIMSILMFSISFIVPYMTFLAKDEPYKHVILENVKYTLWTICLFYPWWVWFTTSKFNSMAGGRVNWQMSVQGIFGAIQISFLAICVNFLFPVYNIPLPLAFFIFFCSDIFYGILFEIIYYKTKWAINITKEYADAGISIANRPHIDDVSSFHES